MAELDGLELMREMIRILEEHFIPLRSTLLDATISCKECGALVLSENEERHLAHHHRQAMKL